ncbi:hypothetical protein TeGR_g625, partial [Tetraparma gracilis]
YVLQFCLATAMVVLCCAAVIPGANEVIRTGYPTDSYENGLDLAVLITLLGSSAIFATGFACWTDSPSLCKTIKVFFFFLSLIMFENFVGLAYTWYVLGYFFKSSTSTWGKMGVRTVVQTLVNILVIEIAWRVGSYLERSLGVKRHHTHVMFAFLGSFMTTMARLMQGSATTFTESVILELTGTLCELATADTLLKGDTPVSSTVDMTMSIKRSLTTMSIGRAEERRDFCGSALIQLSICECSSIFVSTSMFLFLGINPGAPGSRTIPVGQTLVNLFVMLFGELILTDAIIAYTARHWKRYQNDPIKEWDALKKHKGLLRGFIATTACVGAASLLAFPNNFCYTSWRGEGEPTGEDREWVLTQCPVPPENATDLILVGDYYLGSPNYN